MKKNMAKIEYYKEYSLYSFKIRIFSVYPGPDEGNIIFSILFIQFLVFCLAVDLW